MKFLVIFFALVAVALGAPQFGFGGSSSNAAAQAGSQSFGGGPFGFGGMKQLL
jgi:hypothetical protein